MPSCACGAEFGRTVAELFERVLKDDKLWIEGDETHTLRVYQWPRKTKHRLVVEIEMWANRARLKSVKREY